MVLVSKLMLFILFLCIFNVIREAFVFYMCFRYSREYKLSSKRTLGLWASLSYILTVIFMGL